MTPQTWGLWGFSLLSWKSWSPNDNCLTATHSPVFSLHSALKKQPKRSSPWGCPGQCYTKKWNRLKPTHCTWSKAHSSRSGRLGHSPAAHFPADAVPPKLAAWDVPKHHLLKLKGALGMGQRGWQVQGHWPGQPGYPCSGSCRDEEEALLSVCQSGNMYCKVLIILLLNMFGVIEFSMMIWSVPRRGN